MGFWFPQQAYLREQPDNLKTFNIILETTQFVTVLYSNITSENIELCVQLFECINEFTAVSRVIVVIYVFAVFINAGLPQRTAG
jgi:hypothetical protein